MKTQQITMTTKTLKQEAAELLNYIKEFDDIDINKQPTFSINELLEKLVIFFDKFLNNIPKAEVLSGLSSGQTVSVPVYITTDIPLERKQNDEQRTFE